AHELHAGTHLPRSRERRGGVARARDPGGVGGGAPRPRARPLGGEQEADRAPGRMRMTVFASLRLHVRLLGLCFAQYAKARLAYRADFLTSVFATFAGTAASLAVVLILFSRFPHLQGWSYPEIVFLY